MRCLALLPSIYVVFIAHLNMDAKFSMVKATCSSAKTFQSHVTEKAAAFLF